MNVDGVMTKKDNFWIGNKLPWFLESVSNSSGSLTFYIFMQCWVGLIIPSSPADLSLNQQHLCFSVLSKEVHELNRI